MRFMMMIIIMMMRLMMMMVFMIKAMIKFFYKNKDHNVYDHILGCYFINKDEFKQK